MGVGSQKSEAGSWKSEAGSWKLEVGSRKLEVGSRKSEVFRKLYKKPPFRVGSKFFDAGCSTFTSLLHRPCVAEALADSRRQRPMASAEAQVARLRRPKSVVGQVLLKSE